jgi:hypothetical protein
MTVDAMVKQLTYKYKMGYTLKRLYDELADVLGIANSAWVFSEFVELNKADKAFMDEFNSTSFVENVIPNVVD